jgi:hypothetical protein
LDNIRGTIARPWTDPFCINVPDSVRYLVRWRCICRLCLYLPATWKGRRGASASHCPAPPALHHPPGARLPSMAICRRVRPHTAPPPHQLAAIGLIDGTGRSSIRCGVCCCCARRPGRLTPRPHRFSSRPT